MALSPLNLSLLVDAVLGQLDSTRCKSTPAHHNQSYYSNQLLM